MSVRMLFICVHNSARSQMAAAFANHYGEGKVVADSAGLEPSVLNQRVVTAMQEIGIDISRNVPKSVMDVYSSGAQFGYIVTVCDPKAAERCPIFPGNAVKMHWGFEDPSQLFGDEELVMTEVRRIRDEIREKVVQWIKEEL